MKNLFGLTYKECAPVVTAEAMRFLDGDTKRSRVSTSGFSPFWDPQAGIESANIDEFETAIDAGYGLMKLAGRKLFEKAAKSPKANPLPYLSVAETTAVTDLFLQNC